MTNQLALPASDVALILEHISKMFSADIASAIKNKPDFFSSLLKESLTQEIVKKNTLKDVFAKFSPQKGGIFGGLFGRGGLFSYLNQSLFKKSSVGLTAGIPLGKGLDAAPSNPIPPTTPPTPADKDKEPKQKEFLKGIGKAEPIPMLFAGFSGTGAQEITDVFSSLFKTLVKDLLRGLKDVIPEPEENYGEGIIPTLMDSLIEPLLMSLPFIGPLLKRFFPGMRARAMSRTSLGQGKKGAAARRAARSRGRGSAAYTARTGKAPIKPTVPVEQARGAAGRATTGGAARAGNATARTASRASSKGIGSALRSGGKAIPGLGTALTAGFLYSDLSSISEQEAKGELTQKEAYQAKGGAWGSAGGALAGAAAGAALGSVVPGVGTVIGGLVGGIAGAMLGEGAGSAIGSTLAPEEEQPPIAPAPEMPDIDIPEPNDYTQTLNEIASNTSATSDKVMRLSDAIFTLANVFKTQGTSQAANNFFINGQQQKENPSASQVAESNVNAIGRIRQQFAV